MPDTINIHASCVAFGDDGVLLLGVSGCGKSDLALRLIENGAKLVSDDRTDLRVEQGGLIASAPTAIAGLLEVRHIGILRMPFLEQTRVALAVDLAPQTTMLERLPAQECATYLDINLRRLRLHPFEASTRAKIRAALLYPGLTTNA
ncbi:MAG: HPr kinase/phosphatase C-terminal domain-containing protein [Bdellovibrionales bacterium]